MITDVMRCCISTVANLDYIAVLAVFLATMMTVAMVASPVLMVMFNTIMVIAGVFLGRTALNTAGLNFSTSAVFVAAAIFGSAMHHHLHGRQAAFQALNSALFALVVIFGALFLLNYARLLPSLFDGNIRKAGIRLVCIYLMQSLAIYLLDQPSFLPPVVRIPAIVLLCEVLEGIVFYPGVLLGARTPALIIEYTISSVGIHMMTTVLAVPFLIVFLVLERTGVVARCRQTP